MNRYLVILLRRPGLDPAVVPQHRQFLEDMRVEGRNEMSGPFTDGCGGAWLLRAADLAEAMQIAHRDPAHTSGGWEITVREWQAR
ncbi:MAG: hypothetical protein EPN74_12055 [Rhodanobacter sp.]|nr:MAG: hypothetical protein EPN74_12055 [Rhodanobacter sp.]